MKKFIYTLSIIICCQFTFAQITVHDSSAFLDINLIKAKIYTGGMNFMDKYDSVHPNYYEYPANSGKHTILSSALWIGGLNNGNLYLAADQYQNGKRDFYPGPVMDSISFLTEAANWNKVWKINKSDIDYHIANWNIPGYVMPTSISQWPVYANPGLGINYDLAPYIDADSNGFYNPANGDYPAIRGDQAIYFIFNDSVCRHSETSGKRMGIEVHAMAYVYNSAPELDKTVFMNYMIYNRSSRVYDSIFVGNFTDIDIGYPFDDYIGCDTTIEAYFGYNVGNIDMVYPETFPYANTLSYGANPPAQGITLLNQSMTSFMSLKEKIENSGYFSTQCLNNAYDYYLLMKSFWCDTTHLTNYNVIEHPYANPIQIPTSYCFPGNTCDTTSEAYTGSQPYDRRGLGSSGPFSLTPGQFISFDYAYVTGDSISDSCGSNINNLLNDIYQVRSHFNSHHPQDGHDLALGIDEQQKNNPASTPQFSIYPNPTTDKLTFTTNLTNTTLTLDILDINGRLLQTTQCTNGRKVLDVSNFKKGVYIIKIRSAEQTSFVKFIKL